MSRAIVYGLRAVTGKDYFYVGSTKFQPSYRLAQHVYFARRAQHINRHLAHKMLKIGIDNVAIDILEETDHEQRWDRELAWIEKFKSEGLRLVNLVYKGVYSRTVGILDQYALDHPMTLDCIAHGVTLILIENGYPDDPVALRRTSQYTGCSESVLISWYRQWKPKELRLIPTDYRKVYVEFTRHSIDTFRQMFEHFPDEIQSDIKRLSQ